MLVDGVGVCQYVKDGPVVICVAGRQVGWLLSRFEGPNELMARGRHGASVLEWINNGARPVHWSQCMCSVLPLAGQLSGFNGRAGARQVFLSICITRLFHLWRLVSSPATNNSWYNFPWAHQFYSVCPKMSLFAGSTF